MKPVQQTWNTLKKKEERNYECLSAFKCMRNNLPHIIQLILMLRIRPHRFSVELLIDIRFFCVLQGLHYQQLEVKDYCVVFIYKLAKFLLMFYWINGQLIIYQSFHWSSEHLCLSVGWSACRTFTLPADQSTQHLNNIILVLA